MYESITVVLDPREDGRRCVRRGTTRTLQHAFSVEYQAGALRKYIGESFFSKHSNRICVFLSEVGKKLTLFSFGFIEKDNGFLLERPEAVGITHAFFSEEEPRQALRAQGNVGPNDEISILQHAERK